MKDDVAAPNLGQANKEFDAQYFWTSYRTIEQWMQQVTSKGNVSVASLTVDTLAVEDVTVSDDLTVEGTITGDLTGNVTGNLTGNTTVGGTLTVTGTLTASGTTATNSLHIGTGAHGASNGSGITLKQRSTGFSEAVNFMDEAGVSRGVWGVDASDRIYLRVGDGTTTDVTIDTAGSITMAGHLYPAVTATQNLGSASLRWGTVYTSDLSLKNDVGDWTIVEGEDDLFITNNRNGKRYKFALVEVDAD